MKPTIYDVARETGLSIATVSRVINGTGKVKEETRQRVLAAIKRLEYEPSMMAKGLAASTTHILNLSIRAGLLRNDHSQYVIRFINGVLSAAAVREYHVLVTNKGFVTNGAFSGNQQTDGVIFAFVAGNEEEIKQHIVEKKPVVYAGIRQPFDQTGHEVYGGFHLYRREALRELHRRGYRNVAMIENKADSRDRILGEKLVEIVEEANGAYQADGFSCRIVDHATTREEIEALLQSSDRPDALFLCDVSLGPMFSEVFQSLHIKVPEEIGILATSHSKHGGMEQWPQLSTMYVDSFEMGSRAVELLIDEIEGNTTGGRNRAVGHTLIERETLRAAPGTA